MLYGRVAGEKKREGEGGSVSFNTALLIDGTKLKDLNDQ